MLASKLRGLGLRLRASTGAAPASLASHMRLVADRAEALAADAAIQGEGAAAGHLAAVCAALRDAAVSADTDILVLAAETQADRLDCAADWAAARDDLAVPSFLRGGAAPRGLRLVAGGRA